MYLWLCDGLFELNCLNRRLEGMVVRWHVGEAAAEQQINVQDHVKVKSFHQIIVATLRTFKCFAGKKQTKLDDLSKMLLDFPTGFVAA